MSFKRDSREFNLIVKYEKEGLSPKEMLARAPSLASKDKHSDGSKDSTKQIRRTLHVIWNTKGRSAKKSHDAYEVPKSVVRTLDSIVDASDERADALAERVERLKKQLVAA